jgi:hypothetical protein
VTITSSNPEVAMRRTLVLTVPAVVALAAGCGGSSGTGSAGGTASGPPERPSKLVGDVGHGDAFAISLDDPAGHPISVLAAGTYQLVVDDESTIHNFHVAGAGVDDATQIGTTGVKTFSVTFSPGTYSFLCDSHPTTMHGRFTVK